MGSTKNFFHQKHEWSILKDEILKNYLKPYLEKIKKFNRDIAIFDCFAGKGRFDDGLEGSPLIILNQINNSNAKNLSHAYFIEEKYGEELKKNVASYVGKYNVLDENYQSSVEEIKKICRNKNVFLYVDPYGIKSLDYNYFQKFNGSGCNTIELLLNFNSYGFLREGCRLLLHPIPKDNNDIDYEEDDTNTVDKMNKIANDDYWQSLLKTYYCREASLHDVEIQFAKKYENELKKIFKYVVNIPILTKTQNIPKYRMYYGTNSTDGLFLMVDQMNKTWKNILKSVNNGQQELFAEQVEMSISSALKVFVPIDLKAEIKNMIPPQHPFNMKDLYLKIIERSGITYSTSEYKREIKKLEECDFIKISREREKTSTGKVSNSFDFEKSTIFIENI
jgi:three-Cys-motif partner protein